MYLWPLNYNATGEKLPTFYLFQSISMAIHTMRQCVCVMGCLKDTATGLEGLFNFQVKLCRPTFDPVLF